MRRLSPDPACPGDSLPSTPSNQAAAAAGAADATTLNRLPPRARAEVLSLVARLDGVLKVGRARCCWGVGSRGGRGRAQRPLATPPPPPPTPSLSPHGWMACIDRLGAAAGVAQPGLAARAPLLPDERRASPRGCVAGGGL